MTGSTPDLLEAIVAATRARKPELGLEPED